ncbi:MAG: glycosyltransferase family 4 protein [Candidatus Pacebacteria bacterium]|nr:glycosyltransferase family 4 protein [Candidatus Paceibacterota bacterium]
MKKVLIFSLAYYPHVGGAEIAVKEITDRLSPQEFEFHMVTMRFSRTEPRIEKIGTVLVHRIGPGGRLGKLLFQFTAYLKANALHKTYHYSAIWALMAHSSGIPAGLFKKKHKKVFYFLNLQEGDPLQHIERTMRPLWPLFVQGFRRADLVQPLSNFLANWARKMGYTGPIEIIPNGVDLKRFVGEPISHEGTVLITTSRLVHKNAVDDVIRALPLLPSNIRFKILGTGPDEAMLRALVKEKGVENRVEFVGHVVHAEMPAHLHAADIFIRPSRSEGQGSSFIEAMAAGLPVIATQEGGIADFLFDTKRNPEKEPTGWVVDKNNPEQIAQAVNDILEHSDQTKRVITTAKRRAEGHYSWDIIVRDMQEKVFSRASQN